MNKKNLTVEELFFQALENHKKNNIQSAEIYYKEALKLNPNHFETNYYLGGLLAQTNDFVSAKSLFEKAIQTFLSIFDFVKLFFIKNLNKGNQSNHNILEQEININERI